MTKEEMLNLKLYECNRKQCSGFRSCDTGHCHLTTDVNFAVDPEQSFGYDYLITEQLDSYLNMARKEYLDLIIKPPIYPDESQYMLSLLNSLLFEDIRKNKEKIIERIEKCSKKSGDDSSNSN